MNRLCSTVLLLSAFPLAAGDWPQWHGPTRDCRVAAAEKAPTSLPKDPKPVWKIPAGGGHSSPVVAGGKLVYLDENGKNEVAHLLDARTGKEIWQTPFAERFEDEWGAGPRSTPTIDGDRIYAQSCDGEFRCLNLADGKVVWETSFEKDFGVKFLGSKANEGTATRRGNNGSAVVDGDAVIVPVGSTEGATLVCFDKLNGKVLWKLGNDEAAYSAPLVATLAGVKQVVYLSAEALMGVERANGKLLWRVPLKTAAKRHACSPVVLGDTVTVNSHTFGTIRFKIVKNADGFEAAQEWCNKDLKTNLATAAAVGDHLYNQGANKDYVCFDAKSGALKWTQTGFGLGKKDYSSTLVVGQNLLVLTEDGTLLLLAANPEKYSELGRAQVCGNTWSFPAYADGRLYVRDGRQVACYDLLGAR
ncbi:MAG TPA: PQQ-binding-like beta-propeller repeat protein [Verrucomicrobiae bacterium]|nr:PQQ-binding-like beta-propeller repeat protein [Verrucomicrobiae bacterium]